MTTEKEFLNIIKHHILVQENGNIVIKDPKLAEEYKQFLLQFAAKDDPSRPEPLVNIAEICIENLWCPKK